MLNILIVLGSVQIDVGRGQLNQNYDRILDEYWELSSKGGHKFILIILFRE
jgi:hypothetical protein